MSYKISSLYIQVPYKSSGNVIVQKMVLFDLYKKGDLYKAIPDLAEDEKRLADLPDELLFSIEEGKPVSSRGLQDGNLHVIRDIFEKLVEENLVESR
jgi:hypothetical protein